MTLQSVLAFSSTRAAPFSAFAAVLFAFCAFIYGVMLASKLRPGGEERTEPTIEHLTARLNRTENAAYALTLGLVSLGLFAAVSAGILPHLLGQTSKPSVQGLVLRNDAGNIIARVDAENDGAPRIQLYDKQGKPRAGINIQQNTGNPTVFLQDQQGNIRWYAGVGNEGPSLVLTDERDSIRWSAGVNDGGPYLRLFDANGRVRWSVSVDEAGGRVRSFDPGGKEISTPH